VEIHRDDDSGRPRRARPKVLDAPPITYRGGAAAGTTLVGQGDSVSQQSGAGQGFTSETSKARSLDEILGERRVDAALQRDATALATRL
jgi:hypothetical protein